MNAKEARDKVLKLQKPHSLLEKIHIEINNAIKKGYGSVFIKDEFISKDDKESLENEGYLVITRYTIGFEVRWYEKDKNYFESIIKQEHAYLKISDEIIEKYTLLQGF